MYNNSYLYQNNVDNLDYQQAVTESLLIDVPPNEVMQRINAVPVVPAISAIPLPPAPINQTELSNNDNFMRQHMNTLEGLSNLFPDEEYEDQKERESIDKPNMIDNLQPVPNVEFEIRRKTLADVFLDSKLSAQPRNASF